MIVLRGLFVLGFEGRLSEERYIKKIYWDLAQGFKPPNEQAVNSTLFRNRKTHFKKKVIMEILVYDFCTQLLNRCFPSYDLKLKKKG